MRKILILAGRYLPGYKDGGPVRTLINLTDLLGDEYEFRLAVLDRDHGDTERYPNIKVNEWNQVGKAKVWYYPEGAMNKKRIRQLAQDVDLIYTCGFYDGYGYKTLALNRRKKLYGKPVVVASMGSFTPGALSQKTFKKQLFISLCKCLGWFKNITWSVTSTYEEADLKREIGRKAKCIIAEDLPRNVVCARETKMSDKGALKIAFLSRICRHKNLALVIEALKNIQGEVQLTIAGPMQDEEYWLECKTSLEELPKNIRWEYVGEVDSEGVTAFFSQHDCMVLPTLGENFGHVIFESMAAGCIPVISNRTPWNWIAEKNSGYVLPLESKLFARAIQELVDYNAEDLEVISKNAIAEAKEKLEQSVANTGYREIFG